ncbi:hypothetical protein VPNG_07931 [Cytospora leucostoma]|uniref:Uncharacterized protein n=1 Tax=Cytospora leucostoma TaxID=1230097 RepID=A0A423WAP6_9PEZI|nr:hypothetical protein VPNG_07931 [Cytospora leucostoma]
MAPIVIDPNADTTIYLTEKNEHESLENIELRVLAAVLEDNSYWSKFLGHRSTKADTWSSEEHIEETIVSATAVEIVLRALHFDYHSKLKKSEADEDERRSNHENVVDGVGNTLSEDDQNEHNSLMKPENGGMCNAQGSNQAADPEQPVELEIYFPKELFDVPVDVVWAVLLLVNFETCRVAHKANLDVNRKVLLPWFQKWWQTNVPGHETSLDFEYLLFPTFALNDAIGWSYTTQWLCEHTSRGQISEQSPLDLHDSVAIEKYRHLHLPKEVIARIRVARHQLYVHLEKEVWSVARGKGGWFSEYATCACRVVAAYNYRKALQVAGVVEQKGSRYTDRLDPSKTIVELVECLDKVDYEEPSYPCTNCTAVRVKQRLREAKNVATVFRGLCLDCMEASLNEVGSPDVELKNRFPDYKYRMGSNDNHSFDGLFGWCNQCRIPHGHATWYFSWVNPTSRQKVFRPPVASKARRRATFLEGCHA